jgi:hypothetical protein
MFDPSVSVALADLARNGTVSNQLLGLIVEALRGITRFSTGSFTMAAAATKVVADTNVAANSVILLTPTNAAAGTLQQSTETLYISSISAGVSFTVATADAGSAAGTETFQYLIYTPV